MTRSSSICFGYIPGCLDFQFKLSIIWSGLEIVFRANTNALIPLYAIGVFLAFTVAQIGLVRRWSRIKGCYWGIKFGINLIGAIITTVVAGIFALQNLRVEHGLF